MLHLTDEERAICTEYEKQHLIKLNEQFQEEEMQYLYNHSSAKQFGFTYEDFKGLSDEGRELVDELLDAPSVPTFTYNKFQLHHFYIKNNPC